MKESVTFIPVKMGKITVYIKPATSDKTPLILLHGVYFDHHLWHQVIDSIEDRTVITLDMPWHGHSRQITKDDWTLDDCADMLLELLDHLQINKIIAVGHSWGSMTILRAAIKRPEQFASIGLCNMPFQAASATKKFTMRLQHTLLVFRDFYTRQAAKALFGPSSRKQNPDLFNQLKRPMDILTNKQVRHTDKAVIMYAEDASEFIKNLKVPAVALKGEEDYVPAPPGIETILVKGGHVSPLENPGSLLTFIHDLSPSPILPV
jgi:3-oxoadipate enol-lactonase